MYQCFICAFTYRQRNAYWVASVRISRCCSSDYREAHVFSVYQSETAKAKYYRCKLMHPHIAYEQGWLHTVRYFNEVNCHHIVALVANLGGSVLVYSKILNARNMWSEISRSGGEQWERILTTSQATYMQISKYSSLQPPESRFFKIMVSWYIKLTHYKIFPIVFVCVNRWHNLTSEKRHYG